MVMLSLRERCVQHGNLTTITRNKKVLETKAYLDSNDGVLEVSDPIFRVWFKEKYMS